MTSAAGSATPAGAQRRRGHALVLMSIGEVLVHLRDDFPDITISKLRFLESEGLVSPLRTAAGYRKYSPADVSRLRYVLTAQRDHYLPLRVIRDQLAALERDGTAPDAADGSGAPGWDAAGPSGLAPLPAGAAPVPGATALPAPGAVLVPVGDPPRTQPRLTRTELLDGSGLAPAALAELEQHGLLGPGPDGRYDADALAVARLCAALAGYGLQPRHLRAYRVAAERELGMLAQLVAPLAHQSSPEARAKAAEIVRELVPLTQRLQALLLRVGLRSTLRQ